MSYYQLQDGTIVESDSASHWTDAKKLTNKAGKEAMREQAKKKLREWLSPGSRVYTVLRHVSRSGMCRHISLLIKLEDEIQDISGWAAEAMDCKTNDRNNAIIVNGCGMDMGFHLVYNLGYYLWPKGTDKPHGTRNGKPDNDGGYALKHSWL